MDHLTFAQLLGSYGEFIGAIAVVATLGYLAVQLRQNTQSLRISAELAVSQQLSDFAARMRAQPDMLKVWDAAAIDGAIALAHTTIDYLCDTKLQEGARHAFEVSKGLA